jgi:hypothetical protein
MFQPPPNRMNDRNYMEYGRERSRFILITGKGHNRIRIGTSLNDCFLKLNHFFFICKGDYCKQNEHLAYQGFFPHKNSSLNVEHNFHRKILFSKNILLLPIRRDGFGNVTSGTDKKKIHTIVRRFAKREKRQALPHIRL